MSNKEFLRFEVNSRLEFFLSFKKYMIRKSEEKKRKIQSPVKIVTNPRKFLILGTTFIEKQRYPACLFVALHLALSRLFHAWFERMADARSSCFGVVISCAYSDYVPTPSFCHRVYTHSYGHHHWAAFQRLGHPASPPPCALKRL